MNYKIYKEATADVVQWIAVNSGKTTKTSKEIMEAASAIKKPMPPDIAKKLQLAIDHRILQRAKYGSDKLAAGLSHQAFIDLLHKVSGTLTQNTQTTYVVSQLTTTAINVAKFGAVIAALVVFIHYTELDKKIYKFLTEKRKKTHNFRQNKSLFVISKM